MKTFQDLKFIARRIGFRLEKRAYLFFENGYGLLVIKEPLDPVLYGKAPFSYKFTLLKSYKTSEQDIRDHEITEVMKEIQELPQHEDEINLKEKE